MHYEAEASTGVLGYSNKLATVGNELVTRITSLLLASSTISTWLVASSPLLG